MDNPPNSDPGWVKAHTVSNWGYWDCIGDVRVCEPGTNKAINATVDVSFPDGTELLNLPLIVRPGTMTYSDMGHLGNGPDHRAYVEINICGLFVQVRITDFPWVRLHLISQ